MNIKKALKYSLIKTLPVLFGYLFLGFAFGLLLQREGYDFLWAFLISVFVYAGSMQFVMISFFNGGISFITIVIMTLLINSRHIFYGLSFLEKFKNMKKVYPYMIFSLTDETYSLLCSVKVSDIISERKVYFLIAFLNQCYWIIGSILGGLIGQIINFNTKGIDFSMTALFVVIFVEQWKESTTHIPVFIGLFSSLFCLIIFRTEKFILPSLILTVTILILLRQVISKDVLKEQINED